MFPGEFWDMALYLPLPVECPSKADSLLASCLPCIPAETQRVHILPLNRLNNILYSFLCSIWCGSVPY